MKVSRTKVAIGVAVTGVVAALVIGVLVVAAIRHKPARFVFKAMHAPPYEHNATITEDTDRFRGTTTVNLGLMPITTDSQQQLQLRAFFEKPPDANSHVDAVVVTFYSISKEWQFLKYHPLRVLADGAPIDVPPTILNSDVIAGNCHEWISVDLPVSTFIKIANAKKVEARLGVTEFELTPEHLEALRDLLWRAGVTEK